MTTDLDFSENEMLARLRRVLRYSSDTGAFFWTAHRGRVTPGQRAGRINSFGYVQIGFEDRLHLAHRLAWGMTYGEMPRMQIDHINGIRADNRICNLRLVTPQENSFNMHGLAKPASGYIGVYQDKNRWRARIQFKGKSIGLGTFDLAEDAAAAYAKAKREMHKIQERSA